MDSVTESALSHAGQAQTPPDHDTIPSMIQESHNEARNSFQIQDVPGQETIPFHHTQANQNTLLSHDQQLLDIELWKGEIQSPTMMPFFGGDSFARLPLAIPDDFIQFIFNEKHIDSAANDHSSQAGSLLK